MGYEIGKEMFGHIFRSDDKRYQKVVEHMKDTGVLKDAGVPEDTCNLSWGTDLWNTTDEKDVLQFLTAVAQAVFYNSGIWQIACGGGGPLETRA
jgi:hypothetical protein